MAEYYRTKAFVFKKQDKGEADRVFSIFTEDFGRLEVTGKAIRKIASKLRAGIDMFYFSEIEFIQGKNKKILTDAVKIKKFFVLYESPEKIKIALQIADILDNFIKGQEKDKKVFEFLEEFFCNFSEKGKKIKNYRLALNYFFWNFISFQGYRLQVKSCAGCHQKLNPYSIYFSGKDGGIICGHCASNNKFKNGQYQKINSDIAKILRLILNKDWHIISKLKVDQPSMNLLESISENAVHTFSPIHS